MAHRAVCFYRVGEIVSLFLQMGCEEQFTRRTKVEDGDGEAVEAVRYLLNPETGGFMPIGDLEDDESVPWSEVESWERRLGLLVPRPPEND